MKKNEANIYFLETYYFSYLSKDLKMTDEEIKSFIYYAVEQENIQLAVQNRNNDANIKFLLCDAVYKFRSHSTESEKEENKK